MKPSILIFFLAVFVLSCKQNDTASSTPSQTLHEIMQADSTGDLEKVISLYTEDAILIPAASADIIGKNAIREHYRNIFAGSKLLLQSSTNEIIESSDWTIIRGNTTGNLISKTDSTAAPVNDKYLMIMKKQSKKWKIYRLMWAKNP